MIVDQIKRIYIKLCFYTFFSLAVSSGSWTLAFAVEPAHTSIQSQVSSLTIDHLEGSKVFFKAGTETAQVAPYDTQLFDLKPLGRLLPREGDSLPYFLITGRPCLNCSLEKGLFVFRPNSGKPFAYAYPGRTIEPRTKKVVVESRAFFGQCIQGRGDVLVFFQLERVDRHHQMQASVLIAEADKDHLQETLLERRPPGLKKTLQLVKKKVCSEIPGESRMADSPKINLHVSPSPSLAPSSAPSPSGSPDSPKS